MGQRVGRRCRQDRVWQLDLDFEQLALADELDAGVQHEVLRDLIEDIFFTWLSFHRLQQAAHSRDPLIKVQVGQPLAWREPWLRLLARIGDRVGRQLEFFHRSFGKVP